jgi:DMSO reductase anchor subunit
MRGLVFVLLQGIVAVALIASVAYAAQKLRKDVRAGLPHPSLALAVALLGVSALLSVLRRVTPSEWPVLDVVGFSFSVLGLIGIIFSLVHLYWRAWSALDSSGSPL